MSNGRKTLKHRLFKRDGFKLCDENGRVQWFAWCSFGCGTLLKFDPKDGRQQKNRLRPYDATIDHYPIPRRLGGLYTLDNTRLACFPCNTKDGGPAGAATRLVPKGLTPEQRRGWWQQQPWETKWMGRV